MPHPTEFKISPKGSPQITSEKYAEVALPLNVAHPFTYKLSPTISSLAQPGARIVVPLNSTLVTGYIVAIRDQLSSGQKLHEEAIKDAIELLDKEPMIVPEVLEVTRWIAEYYGAPWGEVLKAALPPGITASSERILSLVNGTQKHRLTGSSTIKGQVINIISEKGEISLDQLVTLVGKQQAVKAVRELEKAGIVLGFQHTQKRFTKAKHKRAVRLNSASTDLRLNEAQRKVIAKLEQAKTLPLKDLLEEINVNISTINTLKKKGIVELIAIPVRRDPLATTRIPAAQDYRLTKSQEVVLKEIEGPLKEKIFRTFLLHGVTGSGKTEVYIRAMRLTLQLERSAMMLVPEIALTPLFSQRLRAHFGDQVAIFHSSLSKGERFDEWTRVRTGEARVVIGTRSAVFAPLQNLGLVIVDEEHEGSYRQQDSPIYNGRDTAIVRAQKESAVVILGSATPSLESFHNAQTGKYHYLELPERIGKRPLAQARIIDMREVFSRHGRPLIFSDELLASITQTHDRGEQSIILLNRRGYSSSVLCRSCGEMIQCPNCDVTLTYHRSQRTIICHYCNHSEPAPSRCPACDGEYIYYVGEGTEQIEEILTKQFPTLRIARIDRDTTARRRQFERTLFDFSEGRLDMLVGTQMLAKGHDFPNVTLVGIVSVDAGLVLPDFRAAEKTFQLITQVAGRAGRGDQPGEVLIQTYHPEHYAVCHAKAQDYTAFFNEEIRYRKNHAYPPFVSIAIILLHGPDLRRLKVEATALRKDLEAANRDRLCRIMGPAPAPLARLKGKHRIQLLIKSRSRKQLRQVIDTGLANATARGLSHRFYNLEIDPVSVM